MSLNLRRVIAGHTEEGTQWIIKWAKVAGLTMKWTSTDDNVSSTVSLLVETTLNTDSHWDSFRVNQNLSAIGEDSVTAFDSPLSIHTGFPMIIESLVMTIKLAVIATVHLVTVRAFTADCMDGNWMAQRTHGSDCLYTIEIAMLVAVELDEVFTPTDWATGFFSLLRIWPSLIQPPSTRFTELPMLRSLLTTSKHEM